MISVVVMVVVVASMEVVEVAMRLVMVVEMEVEAALWRRLVLTSWKEARLEQEDEEEWVKPRLVVNRAEGKENTEVNLGDHAFLGLVLSRRSEIDDWELYILQWLKRVGREVCR